MRFLGERRNGAVLVGPPKSSAGVRTVNLPVSALQVLEDHLDLRHLVGTMAAAAGAPTKEVMARGRWSSPQMALRYEHATQDRDRFIARAPESLARPAETSPRGSDPTIVAAEDRVRSCTQRARPIVGKEDVIKEIVSDAKITP